MAAIKALEQWCKLHCDGYRDVAITNMTTSFRNGLAFCALIHKYRPDLIDYDSLRKEDVFENNRLAFQVAEEMLGIPALLDAEDMVALRIPDRLSILTYVSQYYNYFKGRHPMGGVKRPAEGSKEEPSEKKNLPVVAKTFVSKTTVENRSPSTPSTVQVSPKLARNGIQKSVLAENANKSGTLNSKCVACKSHVHLVQRHFVEGKLYHRSCFKCSECSGTLHAGGYKAGKNPDTFICKAHLNCCKPFDSALKTGPDSPSGRLNSASQAQNASPRPSSVLLAPLNDNNNDLVKPVSPAPPSPSWTTPAQKTQSARQRFFQAAQKPTTEAKRVNGAPTKEPTASASTFLKRLDDEKKSRPWTSSTGKKLAEENCNNNNKRPFTIRPAERRLGHEPSSADWPGVRKGKLSQGSAGNGAGQTSTSQTNNKEPPCLKAVNKDNVRPTTAVHTTTKDPAYEWQSNQRPLKQKLGQRDAEVLTVQHECGFISATSSSSSSSTVSIGTTRLPLAPTPAELPVSLALFDPAHYTVVSARKPQPACENQAFPNGSHPCVKSPPRRPAVESISSVPTAPANGGKPSGAKKGKYLSPTDASRTEMRSPSMKSYHIPVEQIERELRDIATNLAQLEKDGVTLEGKLRSCEEEGEGDILMDPLMVDWFNLIRKKQMYIRKESELVYIARTQELEQQQPDVEEELRRLMEKPDHLKSREDRQLETRLMQRLMEIVDGRNAIVVGLDEDRLREVEEDQQLNEMMRNLGVKKAKSKRKSSISKLFRRRSKRPVE